MPLHYAPSNAYSTVIMKLSRCATTLCAILQYSTISMKHITDYTIITTRQQNQSLSGTHEQLSYSPPWTHKLSDCKLTHFLPQFGCHTAINWLPYSKRTHLLKHSGSPIGVVQNQVTKGNCLHTDWASHFHIQHQDYSTTNIEFIHLTQLIKSCYTQSLKTAYTAGMYSVW